jgi:Domain of unknown function (DUF1905)
MPKPGGLVPPKKYIPQKSARRQSQSKPDIDAMDPELARFLREELGAAPDSARNWTITTPLWIWKGKDSNGVPTSTSWYFLTIGGEVATQIRAAGAGRGTSWGMVKVQAIIGQTRFDTSLFPNKTEGSYMLPVKASVRKAEKIEAGDTVKASITVGA